MGKNVSGVVRAKSPFLKWAGRKTRILGELGRLLPVNGRRYVEPFVGSGAVFLNTDYPENVLSDSNADLINLFRALARGGSRFVERCAALFSPLNNQEARFYELRSEFNACSDAARRSELFVYLNRHCFNGLCRYNRKGEFNTPFGRYYRPYFPREEMLAFAEKLTGTELRVGDFRSVLRDAGNGDVVYCDPPYVPLSRTANFTDYASGGFGARDQADLAELAFEAGRRGATVVVSNHDTPGTRELYRRAVGLVPLLVSRTISCDGTNRKKAKELIAVFGRR